MKTFCGCDIVEFPDMPPNLGLVINPLGNGDLQVVALNLSDHTVTCAVVPSSRVKKLFTQPTSVPVLRQPSTNHVKTKRFTLPYTNTVPTTAATPLTALQWLHTRHNTAHSASNDDRTNTNPKGLLTPPPPG